MELLVQACSLQNAFALANLGVGGVIVGEKRFAARLPGDVSLAGVRQLLDRGVKVSVAVNNLFAESALPALERYLEQLARMNVASVYFHDYAVLQIVYEKKLDLHLVYHSETMVTSYGQTPFFAENGVARVVLARELMLPEIRQIAQKRDKRVAVEVQVHGLMFVMQSKWNLLVNYKEYLQDKDLDISQQANFAIREETRRLGNFIYEDENGTHMFTGYELCALEILNELLAVGIDCIRIDAAMKDAAWIEKAAAVYVEALSLAKTGRLDPKAVVRLKEALAANAKNVPLALGFYGGPQTNPHFEREAE